ncbi:alpha/beta fold hydrolase [Candidatus Galacturonibacter soehngenii]|uniref:Alpha/beta hydrolase n=1 Tax=Candidatus Galacturonatibacter soehngenii TaxID=2307010 RepID=A0A7V7QNA0_9FIRM|nr:alpha/beta hydrolase [Candidatus Galacturonibacter soehngenii]KAB1440436.1 alpha/beta hydrolase [Candidatus Galacturonibacter soehngenii]
MAVKIYKNKKAKEKVMDTYQQLLKQWEVEISEFDIHTFYGSTHVITAGRQDAPPLVLFHGVGDNSALMWIYNAKALAKHFRIYAIDTIGGPGKSCPNQNYNKDFDDGIWLDEVIEKLELMQISIAGVSNGAYLAQYYAIHRPERVRKIVCMAGCVATGGSNTLKTMLKIFLPEALFPSRNNTVKLLRKLTGTNDKVFTENEIVLEHYHQLLKGFNNMAMRYHKIKGFSEEELTLIREKALFLIGEEDPFVKLGGKKELLKYEMQYQFFPDTGHGINHERSEQINQILIEYLIER